MRQEENEKIKLMMNPVCYNPRKIISNIEVEKKDNVVEMLMSLKKSRKAKNQLQGNLKKLIERVDLDRPILAQEKMKYIMFEKKESEDEDEVNTPLSPLKAKQTMTSLNPSEHPSQILMN